MDKQTELALLQSEVEKLKQGELEYEKLLFVEIILDEREEKLATFKSEVAHIVAQLREPNISNYHFKKYLDKLEKLTSELCKTDKENYKRIMQEIDDK
jgi:SMC interacting uncharacterized protein involved in chromosome segregation